MRFRAANASDIGTVDALVVPVFADGKAPASLPRGIRATVERIAAESGSRRLYAATTHFWGERGTPKRLVVVNAGKAADHSAERARSAASAGVKDLWRSTAKRIAVVAVATGIGAERAAQAAVEGVLFAMWRPEAHRSRAEDRRLPPLDTVLVVVEGAAAKPSRAERGATGAAIGRGEAIGEAVNLARRLANEPANMMTPTLLAEEARALAKATRLEVEILDEKRCRALGMNSFLSVAQGSHEPPRFVVLRHRGRGGRDYDLGFVGKGITFDSGGISIKPADGMYHMKADMTGAATVIAAMGAIARLGTKANVIAAAPCTENLPGGRATKPGDVFTSMSGRTVEVVNTDAEGRLVLVDGLTYVQREGARRVVDVATLTGAIQIALGHHFTGLFGRPDGWVAAVREAGTSAGDRLWPMPLTDEFRDEIRSDIADLANSAGREGGAIKAAAFLDAAIEAGTSWAHLDIASTYWHDRDRSHAPKGPQGPAVRTLIELARLAEAVRG
ncbi:MAG TPA: leucyl aminopeptidase [Candidatus Limnocylindrales bacterium]|nr:leucyl aminopeptidase [Candidatus Limnocylindrales bacterium]